MRFLIVMGDERAAVEALQPLRQAGTVRVRSVDAHVLADRLLDAVTQAGVPLTPTGLPLLLSPPWPEPGVLTPRQTEVLELMVAGMRNREIATRLDVTEQTVKFHVTAVLRALNLPSRHAAVSRFFQQNGGGGQEVAISRL